MTAQRTPMPIGICDDVDDCVGELDECGICNGPGRFTSADVLTSQKETATATATSSTPWAYVAVTALPMRTPMASATMSTTAWANSTSAASATDLGAIYECGCSDIPEGDCDCDGNQLDALGVCGW